MCVLSYSEVSDHFFARTPCLIFLFPVGSAALFASYIDIQMTLHKPCLLFTRVINRLTAENSGPKEV